MKILLVFILMLVVLMTSDAQQAPVTSTWNALPIPIETFKKGKHTVDIKACDAAGNCSITRYEVQITGNRWKVERK